MAIVLDAADLAIVKADLDSLVLRFPNLVWTYNTDAANEIRYQGALVAPYNVTQLQLQIIVPVAADGTQSYASATFYWIATAKAKLSLPLPDAATRAGWVDMSDVATWVEACIDQMT